MEMNKYSWEFSFTLKGSLHDSFLPLLVPKILIQNLLLQINIEDKMSQGFLCFLSQHEIEKKKIILDKKENPGLCCF